MPRDGAKAHSKTNGEDATRAPCDRLKLGATPDAVTRTMRQVRDVLAARHPGDPEMCMNAELVLAEILNNIVEHGYPPDAAGEIEVDLSTDGRCIVMTTRDSGREMPGLSLPDPDRPDISVAQSDLPEGGFGWLMIRALARDLSYERQAGHNRISLAIAPD
ncbi:MAG: ATP-binding protein [Paracoccaceae bacterium]